MTDKPLSIEDARGRLHELIRQKAPFDDKARDALELATESLGLDTGYVTQIDQKTDHWEAIVTTDGADGRPHEGQTRELHKTYCRETIKTEDHLALHDAPNQGWIDDPAFETDEVNAYLGIPLIIDEQPYGTVCFVAEDPQSEPFSQAETRFAEHLTRLLERDLERQQVEAELTSQSNLAAVFNRVLRHNLRNDINVIRAQTQRMADRLEEDSPVETVFDHVDNLIDLSEKARELEQIVTSDVERRSVAVGPFVETVVETVAHEKDSTTSLSVGYEEDITVSLRPNFERAISELVENAIEFSGEDCTVSVTVETVPGAVEIQIEDNGPGLPAHEAEVLATGEETPLTHGSGLGLWLVHWIVTNHDGSIRPAVSEDGTTITVSIPRTPATGLQQQLSDVTRGRDRYEAAFEEAYDAILILNDDAQIVTANPAASDILGLEGEALLGRSLEEFIREDFDFDAKWRAFLDTGTDRDTISLIDADGTQRSIDYSATANIVGGEHLVVGRDITERKQRGEELQQLNQKLQVVLDTAEAAIFLKDADGRYLQMNQRCREELDLGEEEDIVGLTDYDLFPEDIADQYAADDERVIEEGESIEIEEEVPTDSGTQTHLTRKTPISDDDGDTYAVCGVSYDITERKEQERRLNAIFNQSYQFTGLLEPDGTVIEANERALDFANLDRTGVMGKPFWEVEWFHSDDTKEEIHEAVDRAAEGEFVREEIQLQGVEETAIIDFSIRPVTDEQGDVTLLIPEGRDITARKEREQEVESLKERYETLLDASPDPVFVADAETGRIIETNSAAATMMGTSQDDILGMHQSELHPDGEEQLYRQLFEEHLESGGSRRYLPDGSPICMVTGDGEHIPVEISVGRVALPDGPVMFGIFRDISERVEHEDALMERTPELMTAETRDEVAERASAIARDVLNLPLNGIHFYDPERDGLVPVAVTDDVYEVIGEPPVIGPDDGLAWTAYETGDAQLYGDVREAPEVLNPETPIRSEIHVPLGEHGVLVAASTTPQDFTDADVTSAKILAANVETALNRAEREAELERETERLDEFASIVSHDLRNPLNVAQSRTTLLEEECESEHLEPIQTALERMEEIIEDTFTLARNGKRVGEMEPVNIARRVGNCWEMVANSEATLEIEDDVTIHADPDRVRHICENLLQNAIEHGGEDVTVRIGQADESTIYIEDDGPGIPEDERDAVFEAGYSSVSGGTGFGLAIVQELAEAHGWDVTVTDSESGGARFEFSGVDIQ